MFAHLTQLNVGSLFIALLVCFQLQAGEINGFELSGALIPEDEILHGGPPKDGIPALNNPQITVAFQDTPLKKDDIVIGVSHGGISRAYPIRILNWHEVVNDRLDDLSIVVTYCPLCGSAVVFDAKVRGKTLQFGVSGLLYNSDVLLYDRSTSSLWSQLEGRAISGPYKGEKLVMLSSEHTTWEDWRKKKAHTSVISFDTGFARNYSRDPYQGYSNTKKLYFPVKFRAKGIHPKERVIGIQLGNESKAWPFKDLHQTSNAITDILGGEKIKIFFDKKSQSAQIRDVKGKLLPSTTLFWFAWSAFHPNTKIYRANSILID